ncbi:MAG TPA: hypothetical protein VFS39_05260 [Nitrospira sp.]|nr:hypothetical protein [Nitrospira sp.]
MISLLAVTEEGLSVEVGLVGREGMAGLPRFFGSTTLPFHCVVQRGGEVCQMPAEALRRHDLPT